MSARLASPRGPRQLGDRQAQVPGLGASHTLTRAHAWGGLRPQLGGGKSSHLSGLGSPLQRVRPGEVASKVPHRSPERTEVRSRVVAEGVG